MKTPKLAIVVPGLIALWLANASAINLYPVDDIYIDTIFIGDHSPQELYIANDPVEPHVNELMMKFDLEPFMGESADDAILWLNKFYGCSEGFTNALFYHITEPWNQSDWPVDQYVEHGEDPWSQRIFSVMGWNPVDVTDMVNAWLNGDMPNYGLVAIGIGGTRLSKVYASEAAAEFRPYLEIPSITGIDNEIALPDYFESRAYPNPFNAQVTISYSLPAASNVQLEIFNILGQHIITLVHSRQESGNYQISWNAGNHPSGAYFYRFSSGGESLVKKILLLK